MKKTVNKTMQKLLLTFLFIFTNLSCKNMAKPIETARINVVVTAYSKQEDRVYKNKSATGIYMRSGRTVATDWSKIPVDTIMRIDGKEYRVEDYGSALVRDTSKPIVDLYVNNRKEIRTWGKREKTIEIVQWGSFHKSMEILRDRIHFKHCRTMYYKIRNLLKS